MRGVVSNSTPLIYLAKTGKIELLKTVFEQVYIPEEVKIEVVDKGKSLGKADAYVVEKAIGEGWIKVLAADPTEMPIKLNKGEEAALSLAKQLKIDQILVDEISARSAAKLLGLTPRGTLFILLTALKKKRIELDEFLEILDELIDKGFRLKEEVYVEAIKEARNIASSEK